MATLKAPIQRRGSLVCASFFGLFKVQPDSGPPGLYYAVSWNGNATKAKCTCQAYNFSKPPHKHCKHINEVDDKGCFWDEKRFCDVPTFSSKVRNKRGGVISPIGITFTSFRDAPTIGDKACPNCEGPTVVKAHRRPT